MTYHISPSLLAANWCRLGEDATAALDAGADSLHLDVMDNHYVPNLTVGPMICSALRQYGINKPLSVHLMVQPVDNLISAFALAGASEIIFHPEASAHVDRSLALIKSHNCQAGLAINPASTLDCLTYVLDKLDSVLIMTVNPGFGGQDFIPAMLTKISHLAALRHKHQLQFKLAVDGGIKINNIKQIAAAGADTFIIGSEFFAADNYATVIAKLRHELSR
jgi:ribulose-phosphate 3-epimerase